MAIRSRLGIATAALLCVVLSTHPFLIPETQAQTTSIKRCQDCSAKEKALADQEAELKKLEAELQKTVSRAQDIVLYSPKVSPQYVTELENLNNDRKQQEAKISAARDAIAKVQGELAACAKEKCEPASVVDVFSAVVVSEANVAQDRYQLWLANHSPEQNIAFYGETVRKAEDDLKNSEASRVEAQKKLDELTNGEAVNAAMLSSALGSSEKVPKTNCAECEGPALKLEADLAKLRLGRLKQMRDIAEINALTDKLSGGTFGCS